VNKAIILLLLGMATACGPGSNIKTYQNLSAKDRTKFEKYLILGKAVYKDKCSSCHQLDGKGLRGIIPPLANSDYLESYQASIPCLLKLGTADTITVNGKNYPPKMPAHNLTNLEMAEVLTYINNSWGNEYGFVTAKQIEELLLNCDP
jgi:cytochrome c551